MQVFADTIFWICARSFMSAFFSALFSLYKLFFFLLLFVRSLFVLLPFRLLLRRSSQLCAFAADYWGYAMYTFEHTAQKWFAFFKCSLEICSWHFICLCCRGWGDIRNAFKWFWRVSGGVFVLNYNHFTHTQRESRQVNRKKSNISTRIS